MATAAHAHIPLHVTHHDLPPSPTLTNPEMIIPFEEPHQSFPSLSARPLSDDWPADVASAPHHEDSRLSNRQRSDSDAEVGIATAVTLPMLVKGPKATTIAATPVATTLTYHGYEHGAPLSDIGEEMEETPIRNRGSSPDGSKSPTKQAPPLRHKKRLSNLSTSSGGSDKVEHWEAFDTTQLISDRVAADIARAQDDANENDDNATSRRSSKDVEDELAALNERTEKILANARKRLSSMEDNLSKARHSILLSPRSIPNMHEVNHKPAGGLYRSISQNAANRRSKGLFPAWKMIATQHARAGSEMSTPIGLRRLSGVPEPRSASAMDFSPARYGAGFITSDAKASPPMKFSTHSPSSSRSHNSPLRMLAEEDIINTPSTTKTSPDTSAPAATPFQPARGLGIHATEVKTHEDSTQVISESADISPSMHRSSSQASIRSTKDLMDQMSEMKNRIADLKNKAQTDALRRRSIQSLRSPSPFLTSNINGHGAEAWYNGAGLSDRQSPSATQVGHHGSQARTPPRQRHEGKDSALESIADQFPPRQVVDQEVRQVHHGPVTPVVARFCNVMDVTPVHPSSARTDRNTPNLVSKTVDTYESAQLDGDVLGAEFDEDYSEERFGGSEEDDGQIASSQEEQIYLNEVLEESLHDMEPEVPPIPGDYLIGDELVDLQGEETERHEDRLDAFDYENMFLHSAMGTYRGDDESDSDDVSLVTSREGVRTPTAAHGHESDMGDHEAENTIIRQNEEQLTRKSPRSLAASQEYSPVSARSTSTKETAWSSSNTSHSRQSSNLPSPPQPWLGISRTQSMETVSTVASYQTAMEGEEDEEDEEDYHDEILNWGNAPPHHHVNGLPQYLSAQSVSVKAQNVLGWPASSSTPGVARHASYIQPRQGINSGAHVRAASSSNIRSVATRSPLSSVRYSGFSYPASAPAQPPPNQPLPPPPTQAKAPAEPAVSHQANTEILMESLIKLADPEFSIESTGRTHFADIDKELVLGLLRAVGEVCDGVLHAQHSRGNSTVRELRSRLITAKDVLTGNAEGLEEIREDDEDDQ